MSRRVRSGWSRARRGSALILVLLMSLAVAALAIAAIFMTSSAGMLSRFYDKERLYRLAAESALELSRSRLLTDTGLAIPDTGMTQLLSGWTPSDADGVVIGGVAVNVYAAVTGDTTGLRLPYVTLLAASYDANGTRHVRRMDLRRESFSRYQYFVDSFPSGLQHGPSVIAGRVHSNGDWAATSSGNRFFDTVTVVGTISGSATFDIDSIVGVVPVPYPKDSTFLRLDTLANAAGLRIVPLWGSGRASRLEFVTIDADADGVVETDEGFFRVFDLAAGKDSTYLRGNPTQYFASGNYYLRWDDPRVQNQCGAFYLRSGRWSFFPIATHRSTWARNLLDEDNSDDYPDVEGDMGDFNDYDDEAAEGILRLETARCFPAGSPYLMTTERMTNTLGVVTGDALKDTVPFGVVTPPGGWPLSAPLGYGGSDTTFTPRSRTCTFSTGGTSGRCNTGTIADLGSWQAGTAPTGISAVVRQVAGATREPPYLFAYGSTYNAASRGVISVITNPIYVSGTVTGRVTLRASSRVGLIDELVYARQPNDPDGEDCATQLGMVAVGDVLVVEGTTTRMRRYGDTDGNPTWNEHLGSGRRFALMGTFMSLTGIVGTEHPNTTMGPSSSQIECPENASGTGTRSNGGCLELMGGAIMRLYGAYYSATNYGMRYFGSPDRCQSTNRRPPFFPLTNRYIRVRTLELEPSQANNPTKIRALLARLKGQPL